MPRIATATVLLASLLGAAAGGTPPETGEDAFARKDFRRALELYRQELQKGPDAVTPPASTLRCRSWTTRTSR